MKLGTKYGGEIIIDHSHIIQFPAGIPGFEEEKEFVLMDMSHVGNVAFQALQSIHTPSLAFIVIDPYMLTRDRKSTRLNSSHVSISYAVFCLKKKKEEKEQMLTSE